MLTILRYVIVGWLTGFLSVIIGADCELRDQVSADIGGRGNA